jgi:deazaflavin-dependent oxidoreductase (nitroreductase family)
MPEPATHYQKPGLLTRAVLNPLVQAATWAGLSIWGSRVLEVRGRQSGLPRRTPVNLLELDGHQYLVAPRGEAQWVRNVRADDGRLTLILGRRRDDRVAVEVADGDKPRILRSYLRRWKMEVGAFFEGVNANASDHELLRIAPSHPVFLLSESRHTPS